MGTKFNMPEETIDVKYRLGQFITAELENGYTYQPGDTRIPDDEQPAESTPKLEL